jgi:hypothetical protein
MPTNLLDWSPYSHGASTDKLRALLKLDDPAPGASFDLNMAPGLIPHALFHTFFMPYAAVHHPYDGPTCNCEDLANALAVTNEYIRKLRTEAEIDALMANFEQVKALDENDGLITRSDLPVVGGLAHGNIISLATNATDGRCYFPNHTFCRVGARYYDPTFNLDTTNRRECILREVTHKPGKLRICRGQAGLPDLLFAHDTAAAPHFSDSWWEMSADGWISVQDWKIQTSRSRHKRSSKLKQVDVALQNFEAQGHPALQALHNAFQTWNNDKPNEAKARNKNDCVNGLATFLGIVDVTYPNVI